MPSTADTVDESRPIIVVGCGGHAVVLIEALRARGARILAAADSDISKAGASISGIRICGGDDTVFHHQPSAVLLVNGVGSTGDPAVRRSVFERFKLRGYIFAQVVHPSAVIAGDAELAEGVQVMAGAVIQPRCRIGENTIVNTRAGIDHDGRIGAHVHVAPGATLCGNVTVGDACHIGAGATVIQGVSLAPACIVAAGAVVVREVAQAAMLSGVPAKPRTV
jgi:sugar O-acyltransferase (sialic acid O-acetyltransferase NeuD family)